MRVADVQWKLSYRNFGTGVTNSSSFLNGYVSKMQCIMYTLF